jgi:AraC-like DNA-binding protein
MIGKTRQQPEIEQRFDQPAGSPRGVLGSSAQAGKFQHMRRSAPPDLAHAIDHYWMVAWDLHGAPSYTAQTLPHPNFHLVFEKPQSTINGVFYGKFSRTLEGLGLAFGIKFQPGAFRPFLQSPAASLANQSIPAESIFAKKEIGPLKKLLTSAATSEDEKIEAANAFLRAHVNPPNTAILEATQLVRTILDQPAIRTVDDLSAHTGIGKRSLQRLFHEYVGATPKWVIRRYRLHELVERLKSGHAFNYAQLALDLGYFDQAHLIRDFRRITGYTPAKYSDLSASKI